jgi:GNAT superfamily N-acetyltransferase
MPVVVRRAIVSDIDAILELLTEYDLPRTYFEPYYYRDPTYRPEHSWLVVVDGRLAAHLRIFDRCIYVHGVTLHVAGIGNVITGRAFRGGGFAGRLLRAVTREAPADGFVYSLLWTHLPALYNRYGWVAIDQEAIHASLNAAAQQYSVAEFTADDLPDVMRLYESTNQVRSGPTVRSADYWRAQLTWTREDLDGFLLTRDSGGSLTGYIRSRRAPAAVEILELGAVPGEVEYGRELAETVASRRAGQIEAQLPPSLYDVVAGNHRQVVPASGLMGRVLDVTGLLTTLEPVLVRRAQACSRAGCSLALATSAGVSHVVVGEDRLSIETRPIADAHAPLGESDLAHLLFHGFDATAAARLEDREDADMLGSLFPAQDFIVWPSDQF